MRRKIKSYVSKWKLQGYANGIPDSADSNLENMNKVPSYKMICMAILKNDICLTSLGFSRPNCAEYNALKKIEIEARK